MTQKKTDLSNKNDTKRNTSLRLGHDTLKALKIRAVEENTSLQKLVENLIEAYLDGRIEPLKGKPKK